MDGEIKKTCLHGSHVALGAQMSPFAGFDMPIQYVGITQEHLAVRLCSKLWSATRLVDSNSTSSTENTPDLE